MCKEFQPTCILYWPISSTSDHQALDPGMGPHFRRSNTWWSEVGLMYPICETHVMHLNHPEAMSSQPWSMDRLSSMKWDPGAKKVGDCCSRKLCWVWVLVSHQKSWERHSWQPAVCGVLAHGHIGSRGMLLWECATVYFWKPSRRWNMPWE